MRRDEDARVKALDLIAARIESGRVDDLELQCFARFVGEFRPDLELRLTSSRPPERPEDNSGQASQFRASGG